MVVRKVFFIRGSFHQENLANGDLILSEVAFRITKRLSQQKNKPNFHEQIKGIQL